VTVFDAGGAQLASAAAPELLIQPVDSSTILDIGFKDSHPASTLFRGQMRLRVTPTGLQAVNIVPLESYLRGVVPSEMPASWPLEALKAQAVAARSYAWPKIKTTGDYDITPTAGAQVYKGVENEHTRTDQAVAGTYGKVLMYNGNVATAYYHSTAGGYTEHTEYAFVGKTGTLGTKVAYARGKPDVDANGIAYDIGSPSYDWQSTTFTMAQLSQILSANPLSDVGEIYNITFYRGVSGRIYKVFLEGSKGELFCSGGVFKNTYNDNRFGGAAVKSTMYYLHPVVPPATP
jgi:stage II sporulation protein D